MADFAERVASIGALGDPLRRDLYLYVCAKPYAVSRDEAADALGVPLHKAKFHLDRLEAEGLLTAEFARLTGRSGPGAGRPAKLYRRAPEDISVSLPGREYEIAGQLLAAAVATSARTGGSPIEALHQEAAQQGREWAQAALADDAGDNPLALAMRVLAQHGYEPREDAQRVILANCPFHTLAASHTEMVCGMNLALLQALVDEVGPDELECHLEPDDQRCCVVLAQR
ncbi:helix-turn-helix transcriptional regulator [Aeromicrobium sp.]|uniref:helix-turn-helix transcriptional regulator n=1 Tax=Aeromicrobium sp. TaxID=1871063 RepID=UPI002FC7F59B